MAILRKIAISSFMLLSAYGNLFAQDHFMKPRCRKQFTIGFQTGRELLFNSSPLLHSRQSKVHYGVSTSLVLRKPLSSHFKLETGLKYTAIPDNNTRIQGLDKKTTFSSKHSNVAAPFTLQYYFIPEHSRVRAYCGGGVQYNLFNNGGGFIPFNSDISADHVAAPGTKYISVLMTQGMTFQISTRIQLTESFHFIPVGAEKSIGFDLGIGYNIR